jgi:predicted Zn-ribbon and HTH transcriptional regulator
MSQLECPSCGLKIAALGAPSNCPRCLIRKGERIELVPLPAFVPDPDIPPSSATESHASLQAH